MQLTLYPGHEAASLVRQQAWRCDIVTYRHAGVQSHHQHRPQPLSLSVLSPIAAPDRQLSLGATSPTTYKLAGVVAARHSTIDRAS